VRAEGQPLDSEIKPGLRGAALVAMQSAVGSCDAGRRPLARKAAVMSTTDPGVDGSADGWCFLRDSWMFHRWYFHVYGRPTERGLYSFLLRQLRWKRGPEVIVAGVFRLKMPDGSPILATGKRGASARLQTVLPPDWKIGDPVPWLRNPPRKTIKPEPAPERVKASAVPVLVAHPAQAVAPPVAATRKPLLLGGKNSDVAATLLEYRKRRWG
jgi:hypothetical protein